MQLLKKIVLFPINIIKITLKGLIFSLLLISRGFFGILKLPILIIQKILPNKFTEKLIYSLSKKQEQPEFFLLLVFFYVSFITIYNIFYIVDQPIIKNDFSNNEEVKTDEEENNGITNQEEKEEEKTPPPNDNPGETNLFRIYNQYNLNQVDFNKLKAVNDETVAWLRVDYTNINYPIVQTDNNDFYLSHTFDKSYKNYGWTYMDYRNNPNMEDKNTIFYGHYLFNKTSFGSLSDIFTDSWQKNSNKTIIVMTENKKNIYEIFSAYHIKSETFYLKTSFPRNEDYKFFIETIKKRNSISTDVDVSVTDKIITLSTCSEDNSSRTVVHAKLINTSDI